MRTMKPFRFHDPYDNTSKYFKGHANNFPYGAPDPSLADDDLPFGDEPTVKACDDEDWREMLFVRRLLSRIELRCQHDSTRVRPFRSARFAPRGAWGRHQLLWVVPPSRGRSPPFTERGSHYKLTGQRGVVNFILHLPFYLAFSKIPDLPQQISFSKIL